MSGRGSFTADIIATAYREEMRRQHEATGATTLVWPHDTGWRACVRDGVIVVRDEAGGEWRYPLSR